MGGESEGRGRVAEWFREAWAQALVTVGAAEVEAGKVAQRAGELAGWRPDEVRSAAAEFGQRLATQRRELDETLNRALGRVKVVQRQDVERLAKRVERIAERLDALESKRRKKR